jgi:WD40 repeat protein
MENVFEGLERENIPVADDIKLSVDGQYVLSSDWKDGDCLLQLRDTSMRRDLWQISQLGCTISFSPDSNYIVASEETRISVLDIETGDVVHSLNAPPGHGKDNYFSVAISPDNNYALTASWSGQIRLLDVHTEEIVHQLRMGSHMAADNLSGSPDVIFSASGQYALSGMDDSTLQLWDVHNGTEVYSFGKHGSLVTSTAFSPDGQYILYGSADGTVRLWDVQAQGDIRTFIGHNGVVNSVAFSPDGQYAISGSEDGTLRLWAIRSLDVIVDDICSDYYIDPNAESAMRQQYDIPDDVVLCPEK